MRTFFSFFSPSSAAGWKADRLRSSSSSEDEEFKWWEAQKDDDSKKWDSLQHNGVLFPPEYVPLPKKVKMLYDSKPVDLPPESEEVATFFGSMLNTDHVQKAKFCENFFDDFKDVLKDHPPVRPSGLHESSDLRGIPGLTGVLPVTRSATAPRSKSSPNATSSPSSTTSRSSARRRSR